MSVPPKSRATEPPSKVLDAWAMITWLLDQATAREPSNRSYRQLTPGILTLS